MSGIRYAIRQVLRYLDGFIQVAIFVLTLIAVVGAYDSNPVYVTACGALAALGALWAFWRQFSARRAIMARQKLQVLEEGLPIHTSPTTWAPYAPTLSTPRPRARTLISSVGSSHSISPPPPPVSKGLDRQRLNYIQQLTGTPFRFEDKSHGPPHQPIWTSQLYFGGKLVGESQHSSKKAAQEGAAAMALHKFEEEEKSRSSSIDNEKVDTGESEGDTDFEGYLVDVV
ncbi:uncharacterized protein SCHCODRAFT_02664773 [Schizophyllum commune H4-8]|nr:uncharacterized protein SCHCODRAFT_02664773 [Schizophyllum commune H4-8]KAI5897029.1 hypothetical protein SCHCODRAFT_02664773 [Schizophyllum commune H4-8]